MFKPKDYLLFECDRIESILRETLRNRYTRLEFLSECQSRLGSIRRNAKRTTDDNLSYLADLDDQLDALSVLVTSIERSHAEEFSWPFASSLERISREICRDTLFFYGAEGGTLDYWVQADRDEKVFGKRIASVVFPRAFKDNVLIHAVLGHELGHAVLTIRENREAVGPIMDGLLAKSPLRDLESFRDWCSRVLHTDNGLNDERQLLNWKNEFFCDIFGLIIMGPAFLHALMALLYLASHKTRGRSIPTHPPLKSRLSCLLHAARTEGALYRESGMSDTIRELCAEVEDPFIEKACNEEAGDFDVFGIADIRHATQNIREFAATFESLVFPPLQESVLQSLVTSLRSNIPPIAPYPPQSDARLRIPTPGPIDFRHILFAGWVSCAGAAQDAQQFEKVNNLCSYAIMQQEGVYIFRQAAVSSAV